MVLSLTHQTLLLKIRVSLDWKLCANQCWAIIIQHCCYVIDSRRRGGLVINSSNFTSLGHNFSSYYGIVSFFPFPLYYIRYWMLLASIRRGLNLFITDLGMNLSLTRVLFQGSLHNRRFMSQTRQTRHFARLALHAKCRVRLVWVRSANPRWRPLRC